MQLDVRDVSKRFGARWALARITLTIKSGEAVMLAGHNGSGKTTLLRLLAAATMPTLGDCSLGEVSLKQNRDHFRAHVALLSHASGHYDDLSARENLRVHAGLMKKPVQAIDAALDAVGLSARADAPVREYSAGMKKRLAIARVMLKQPPIILLDEPFGELDPQGMEVVEAWMKNERAAGKTLVLATHWLEQGGRLTDRAIHLQDGRVA
jgi:heme exporter protein A